MTFSRDAERKRSEARPGGIRIQRAPLRLRSASRLTALVLILAFPAAGSAHPVPRNHHDRTIAVHLIPDPARDQVVVIVNYRLEVDELTVVLDDMQPFKDDVDLAGFRNKPDAFYSEFTRLYAPILANNLTSAVDGKPLHFQCVTRSHRLKDEEGRALGHEMVGTVQALGGKPGPKQD